MEVHPNDEFLKNIRSSYLWTLEENSSTTLINHDSYQSKSVDAPGYEEIQPTEAIPELPSSSSTLPKQAWTHKDPDWSLLDTHGRRICRIPIMTILLVGLVLLLCMVTAGILIGIIYGVIHPMTASTSSTSTTTSTSTSTSTSITSTTTSETTTTTTVTSVWTGSNVSLECLFTCMNTSTVTPSTLMAYWTFENNLSDQSGNGYLGTLINGGNFVEGYIGNAIELESTYSEYIRAGYMSWMSRSFTVEAWLYLYSLAPSGDRMIFSQCETTAQCRCLHYTVRSNRLYLGFYNDDISGRTELTVNVWYHVAFVYDFGSNMKMIYLNGILDGISTYSSWSGSVGSYLGASGDTILGSIIHPSIAPTFWNGRIDQLKVSNFAKTYCQILHDATLIAFFPFNYNSIDVGPNSMSGTIISSYSWVAGRAQGALSFTAWNSYFYTCGYYALGRNLPYSISLWVNPSARSGTILHLSSSSTGLSAWCLPMIGFHSNESLVIQTSTGTVLSLIGPIIPLNVWTHLLVTWSSSNGLSLYLNGELYRKITASNFASSGVTMCILLGNSFAGTSCATRDIVMGLFQGSIDEFAVYNRELSSFEACTLSKS